MLSVSTESFSEAQKLWYYQLIVAAILADGQIKQAEMEYLNEAVSGLPLGPDKAALVAQMGSKKAPPVTPPPEFPSQDLAEIYLEVIEIMICDVELDPSESRFIYDLSKVIGVNPKTENEVMRWAEEGIQWHSDRDLLIYGDATGIRFETSEVKKDSAAQKEIYAKLLLTTSLQDPAIAATGIRAVRHAISLMPYDEQQVMDEAIRAGKPPALVGLGFFDPEYKRTILVEVLEILASDKKLPEARIEFFTKLCDVSEVKADETQKMLAWSQAGITWHNTKDQIITNFEVKG